MKRTMEIEVLNFCIRVLYTSGKLICNEEFEDVKRNANKIEMKNSFIFKRPQTNGPINFELA